MSTGMHPQSFFPRQPVQTTLGFNEATDGRLAMALTGSFALMTDRQQHQYLITHWLLFLASKQQVKALQAMNGPPEWSRYTESHKINKIWSKYWSHTQLTLTSHHMTRYRLYMPCQAEQWTCHYVNYKITNQKQYILLCIKQYQKTQTDLRLCSRGNFTSFCILQHPVINWWNFTVQNSLLQLLTVWH